MPSNTRSVWQKKVTLCWSSSCFWKDFNIKVKNIHSRLWSVCSFESEPFIIWRGRNWRGVQVLTTGLRWELELVLNCKWTWDKWSDTCSARVWRRRCKVRCSGLRGVQVFYLTQQGSEGICYVVVGGGGVLWVPGAHNPPALQTANSGFHSGRRTRRRRCFSSSDGGAVRLCDDSWWVRRDKLNTLHVRHKLKLPPSQQPLRLFFFIRFCVMSGVYSFTTASVGNLESLTRNTVIILVTGVYCML